MDTSCLSCAFLDSRQSIKRQTKKWIESERASEGWRQRKLTVSDKEVGMGRDGKRHGDNVQLRVAQMIYT